MQKHLVGIGKQHIIALAASFLPNRLRQMCLTHSGGTAHQHITPLSDKVTGRQSQHLLTIEARIEGKREAAEGFGGVDVPSAQPHLQLFLCSAFHLIFEETGEKVLVAPLPVQRLTMSGVEGLEHSREAQGAQLVSEGIVHIDEKAPLKAEKSSLAVRAKVVASGAWGAGGDAVSNP